MPGVPGGNALARRHPLPKCGSRKELCHCQRKTPSRNKTGFFYRRRECRRQFTATVGTIFEDSKIPLSQGLAALFLMGSSKQGISARQLYRLPDLGSYRAAWFMTHRIREAMREKGLLQPLIRQGVDVSKTRGIADQRPAYRALKTLVRQRRPHQSRDGVLAGGCPYAEQRKLLVAVQAGHLWGASPHRGGIPALLPGGV